MINIQLNFNESALYPTLGNTNYGKRYNNISIL